MPLYLYILIASAHIPLVFTVFYSDFIIRWKNFFISTSIVAFVFLIWDALFTKAGIWEFNEEYCVGLKLFMMPIEEWLFFYVIPFCSLFIHFVLISSFQHFILRKNPTRIITVILIVITCLILFNNLSKAYTAINGVFLLTALVIGFIFHQKLLQRFLLSFLIILIPFFIVNGILTGLITESPIVKYNDLENLGVRVFTIPVEDIGYAFSMLFGNLMIFEWLNRNQEIKADVPIS
jgi:lycopene cyclase domain-containing protein